MGPKIPKHGILAIHTEDHEVQATAYTFGDDGNWSQTLNHFCAISSKGITPTRYKYVKYGLAFHRRYPEHGFINGYAITLEETEHNEEPNMKLKNAALLIRDDITTIKCRFDNGGPLYTYICPLDVAMHLNEGDFVITRGRSGHSPFNLAVRQVVSIDDEPDIDLEFNKEYRWAVQKVDIERLNQYEQEQKHIQKQLQQKQVSSTRQQVAQMFGVDNPTALLENARKAEKEREG